MNDNIIKTVGCPEWGTRIDNALFFFEFCGIMIAEDIVHFGGFDISADILRKGSVRWNVRANLTYMANRITAMDVQDFSGMNIGGNSFVNYNSVASPVGSILGYIVDADGNIVDQTGDGRFNESDKVFIGSSIPKIFGGLTSNLSFGHFSFQLSLDWAAGHKVANMNNYLVDVDLFDAIREKDSTYSLTSKMAGDGDFLRLGLVGLKYDIPVSWKWIKKLSVGASCYNAAIFSRYDGWSPDVNCFGITALSNGLDYGSYPFCRTFMLSFSAQF